VPDLSLFPLRAWIASMRRAVAVAPHAAFDYPNPRGPKRVRVALAEYLNRARATRASADRLVFCGGSAQGIGLLCQVLRARGVRSIAVEEPGHADQCTDIRAAGLQTPRIPVDEQGLCIEHLTRTNAGAVLVTPAHQYPTGAVLSAERRARLLEWAAQRGALVIEDDYDAEYRYDREPIGALQGLAPERVAYVGSVSKTLSPALRIGWVLAPADLAAELARVKFQVDRGAPTLDLLALADFVERGELDRHLRKTRQIYRRRHNLVVNGLAERLPALRVRGIAAGLHLMVALSPGADEDAIVDAAAKRSMRLYGARQYHANGAEAPPALVAGYGGIDEGAIPAAVTILAEVLSAGGR
jgi:GntR family transcriptional regulator/MocR family aminotransferase